MERHKAAMVSTSFLLVSEGMLVLLYVQRKYGGHMGMSELTASILVIGSVIGIIGGMAGIFVCQCLFYKKDSKTMEEIKYNQTEGTCELNQHLERRKEQLPGEHGGLSKEHDGLSKEHNELSKEHRDIRDKILDVIARQENEKTAREEAARHLPAEAEALKIIQQIYDNYEKLVLENAAVQEVNKQLTAENIQLKEQMKNLEKKYMREHLARQNAREMDGPEMDF